MAFSEIELKRIDRTVGDLCRRRCPPKFHNEVRLDCRVTGHDVVIYESRPGWRDPSKWTEHGHCKASSTFAQAPNGVSSGGARAASGRATSHCHPAGILLNSWQKLIVTLTDASSGEVAMPYDERKIDEAVLAVLFLTAFDQSRSDTGLEGHRLGSDGTAARSGVDRRPERQNEVDRVHRRRRCVRESGGGETIRS